jgi:hypothetical protein
MRKVFDNTQAFREGWGLFMCDDGLLRVQRLDDRLNDPQSANLEHAPAFESDDEAIILGCRTRAGRIALPCAGLRSPRNDKWDNRGDVAP